MAVVTSPEADLLTVARAVMGAQGFDSVQKLLLTPRKAPKHLGPTAGELLKGMLGKGAVLALAKGGGYQRTHAGRLWQRQTPPRLVFGLPTIRLLQWVLEVPLAEGDAEAVALSAPLGLGDELFLWQLLKLVHGTVAWPAVATLEAARQSPLCTLGFAFSLGTARPLDSTQHYAWNDAALNVVDAWQPLLAKRWVVAEAEKARVAAPSLLRAGGLAQGLVLESFLPAIDKAGRRELSFFLVNAAAKWLGPERDFTAQATVAALSSSASLRERQEARRAAAAPYRALARLAQWDLEHRNLRFIDDGYEKAQAAVKAYEMLGERGFRAAAQVLDALENTV